VPEFEGRGGLDSKGGAGRTAGRCQDPERESKLRLDLHRT
jgi:hypothetical protein